MSSQASNPDHNFRESLTTFYRTLPVTPVHPVLPFPHLFCSRLSSSASATSAAIIPYLARLLRFFLPSLQEGVGVGLTSWLSCSAGSPITLVALWGVL